MSWGGVVGLRGYMVVVNPFAEWRNAVLEGGGRVKLHLLAQIVLYEYICSIWRLFCGPASSSPSPASDAEVATAASGFLP